MKIVSTTIILCSLVYTSMVFAADTELGDCRLFAQGKNPKVSFADSFDIGDIYPAANRTIALQNLKKYCCANYQKEATTQQWWCSDSNSSDNNYGNSNLLYDHLVDVGFRAIDGDSDLAYNGQELDPVGEKRYQLLYGDDAKHGYATNPLWTIPLEVRTNFWLYRWISSRWSLNYNLNEFKDPKNNKDQYNNYKNKWTTLPTADNNTTNYIPLASRYLIICHIAQQIVANGEKGTQWFSACKRLALKRINDETQYMEYVLSTQATTALMKNFNAYTQWYFVQWELARLLEKITEMNAGLTHVNNKVSEMTKMCSN